MKKYLVVSETLNLLVIFNLVLPERFYFFNMCNMETHNINYEKLYDNKYKQ